LLISLYFKPILTHMLNCDLLSDLKGGTSIPSLIPSGFRTADRSSEERPVKVECPPFRLPPYLAGLQGSPMLASECGHITSSIRTFFVQKSFSSFLVLTLSTRLENLELSDNPIDAVILSIYVFFNSSSI